MRVNYELPLSEADNLILSFFEGDVESSELFIEIAAHMIDDVPGSLIRYNASIVGVAKPGERYRFYVSKKDGVYSIKYKYEQEARLFVMDKKEEFLLCNTECNKYFDEHPELMISENTVMLIKLHAPKRKVEQCQFIAKRLSIRTK